jgi:hypothetical protein
MKKLALLAAAAALSFASALGVAFAADLNKNAAADLEERVAELEAKTATKGNRRVTVEISGQVTKALLFVDGEQNPIITDSANAPSRFAFSGAAKIAPHWSAGYHLEIAAGDDLFMRKSNVWLAGPAGRLTLGRQSMATDGISEISVANTNVANLPSGLYGPVVDGIRDNAIRFDSNMLAGFTAAVAWSAEGVWDAALRYAAEDKVFRLAAGVGFARAGDDERWSGSASIMHLASGLFVNGVYGRLNFTDRTEAFHVTAGIERNWFGPGKTTLYGESGRMHFLGESGKGLGLGVVQAIDAAQLDIFATYRSIENIDVVQAGMRVRF